MSQTTVNLGFVPKNREIADWDNLPTGTKFYKDNIVQFKGSSYICSPVGYDPEHPTDSFVTVEPWTESPQVLNAGWKVFASGNNKFTTGESVDTLGVDNEPTAGSDNLVKSGGIQKELALGAVYDVSAKNPTAGSNNDGKWESLSALLSDVNLNTLIPTSVRKGGMSIKFVQSSENKYVQYRLISTSFTTDVTQWYGFNEDLDSIVNGKDDRNYIPNKIVDDDGIVQNNPGTIVSVELANILGKTIDYISSVGNIAYYKQDGTLYAKYAAQGTRSLVIPGSNVIHHVIASFDAANSTYGIKQGDEWLYYPSGDLTYGLSEIEIRNAILSDALCYSNIVYNGEMIVSASVKYPDGNEGVMNNIVYSGSNIVSVDYSYGTDVYRVSVNYDADKVTSNNITKI